MTRMLASPVSVLVPAVRYVARNGRLPLRERYWRREDGRLRLRYVLATYMATSALMSFTALSLAPKTNTILTGFHHPAPVLAAVQPQSDDHAQDKQILKNHRDAVAQVRRTSDVQATAALIAQAGMVPNITTSVHEKDPVRLQKLTITSGDTLSSLLVRAGLSGDDADTAIRAMRDHMSASDLKPGQELNLKLRPQENGYQFAGLSLALDPVRTVQVERGWGGFLTASMLEKPLKQDVGATVAVVKASLYGAANAAGVPSSVTAEAIKAFGHQIDFQRDIHPGDRLEIMYDRMVTDDGYVAKTGGLVFARLYADDRELTIYRFKTRDGRTEYFDRKGNSIRKALLRTPLDGARLTSGFGMRRHPILGYSKMHKGVDFGASTGTPIYAAGDGTVEKAGRFGAYGNYVRLKHTGTLKTAYAHMSRFASGMRPGARVKQGQIIGYVGTTGRSTGPHLHYEVLMNDSQVNPQSVKMPTMVSLDGADMKRFRDMVSKLDSDFKNKTHGLRYASSNGLEDGDFIR